MEASFNASTAYHEAGHAVVALALGRPVQNVSILPNREVLGICKFGKARTSFEDWLGEILIALGGIAAEVATGNYAMEPPDYQLRSVWPFGRGRQGQAPQQALASREPAGKSDCWQPSGSPGTRAATISGRTAAPV